MTTFCLSVRFFRAARLCCGLVGVFLLWAGFAALPGFARQTPEELRQQGDRYWNEGSYALAVDVYQKLAQAVPNAHDRGEVELRITEALIRTQRWDEAVSAVERFVRKYTDTPDEIRGQVWRGRLYATIPHFGYKVGERIFRGQDVPKSQGRLAPVFVTLERQDAVISRDAFARAKALLDRFRREQVVSEVRSRLTSEEIELNFDLVHLLQEERPDTSPYTQDTDWRIDVNQAYSINWPVPKQIVYLYEQIPALDRSLASSNHHAVVLARLGEAAYILNLRAAEYVYPSRINRRRRQQPSGGYAYRNYVIPYSQIDPIRLLQETLAQYPKDTEADRLLYTIGFWLEQKGDVPGAESYYSRVISEFPSSRWASDARSQFEAILRPSVSLSVPNVSRPATKPDIYVQSRNVRQVRFIAYRVFPEEVYTGAPSVSSDSAVYRPAFDNYGIYFPENGKFRKERVAEWTLTTGDNGKHNPVNDISRAPFDSPGAYLVEAHAGDHDSLKAHVIVFVSDITMVQKVDRDSLLVYVADAMSGKPLADVTLKVWAPTRYYGVDRARNAQVLTGVTDSTGTFHVRLPETSNVQDYAEHVTRDAEVFAYLPGGRYALTPTTEFRDDQLPIRERAYRAYVQTDKPLYRPKQDVHLHVDVTHGVGASTQFASGDAIELLLTSPRGNELFKTVVTMNGYGSADATYALPDQAELGDYTVTVRTAHRDANGSQWTYGNGGFRVEEYKKPEFAVTVAPEQAQVRLGETAQALISARYFFGSPVANAKVHYRVFQSLYLHPLPFPPHWDWYPMRDLEDDNYARYVSLYNRGPEAMGGAIYLSGELTTDAKGEAHLSFPSVGKAKDRKNRPETSDVLFTIVADVVDDSRRQVSGSGTVNASVAQYHVALRPDRKFVIPGENLKIEVATHDASDCPVSASGRIHLIRLIPAVPEERAVDPRTGKSVVIVKYVPPQQVDTGNVPVSTDAAKDGMGLAFWSPDTPGDYRLDYSSTDAWGNTVTASALMLVYGPGYDTNLQKTDQRCELIPQFAAYRPGDTAHLLLIAPVADSYVLFTEAAVGSIIRYRTLFVPGRSTIVDVNVGNEHLPNARFDATVVHDGTVVDVQTDIGVVAEGKILALSVVPDKAQYKPGERATFALHAVDALGQPVRGEITLGVVDDALLAIRPDSTPDIRSYFYGYRVNNNLGIQNSVGMGMGGLSYTQSEMLEYDRHSLVFPEGMGWLFDHIGDQNREIPGYIGLNGILGATMLREGIRPEDLVALNSDQTIILSGNTTGFGGAGGRGGGGGFGGGGFPDARMGRAALTEGEPGPAGPAPINVPFRAKTLGADSAEAAKLNMEVVPPLVAATVRSQFADTAFWAPTVVTDANGNATVSFRFPDNITSWHTVARGVAGDVRVGVTTAETITKKNLLVRLQAPRFFVDRDLVTLSANVHNYLETEKHVRVELVADGTHIGLADGTANGAVRDITVGKDAEVRVDWTVKAQAAGQTHIKVVVQTDEESDATEMEFPVLVHGVEKFLAQSQVLRNGGETTLDFDLPAMRRQGATLLDVQMQPSIAAMLVDALPYLEDYPYGCVEQTTSRFVPSVLVAKALQDAGIDLETLGKRAAALEEQRRTIPPQQVYADSGYTYPKGVPGVLDAATMASRLAYHGRSHEAIYSSSALHSMVEDGLNRLYDMQRGDGSWGWWKGSAVGDPYLTAYVVQNLIRAQGAGVVVKSDVLNSGVAYLRGHLDSTENLHLLAYYAFVLSLWDQGLSGSQVGVVAEKPLADTFLYLRRDRLNAYGQALLALALEHFGDHDKAQVLLRNLINTAKQDRERGSVHWESEDRDYWHWYNDKQETTAMVLRALITIAPAEQLAPVNGAQADQTGFAPLAVRWLVDNRRGGFWTSTRQTANVVEALLEYAKAQHELAPDYTVTLDVDGRVAKSYHLTAENALLFDNRFLVGDEVLVTGANHLHVTMRGMGTLYLNAYMKFFDMEEPIRGVSNAIGVERKYYKIVPVVVKEKRSTLETTERVPLEDGAQLVSGDIVEVELNLKSDNDYDYVVFEDMKPAGFEATATESGVAYGDGVCSNFELRDEKVAFFVDHLPQGTRRITYRLRAEIPGAFHALPTNAYAMYTPDIRAISDEFRIGVRDVALISLSSRRTRKPSLGGQ